KLAFPHWEFTDSDIRALLRPSGQSQAPKLEEAIRSLKIVELDQQNKYVGLNVDGGILIKCRTEKIHFENAVKAASTLLRTTKWNFSKLSDQLVEECL